MIKVRAHRAEPLNELADSLASEAAESDDSRPVVLDLDPEAVHFLHKTKWVEWDARVREDLVQRAATQYVARAIRRREERSGAEAGTPALPFTTEWLLRPDQGRETLGRVLEGM